MALQFAWLLFICSRPKSKDNFAIFEQTSAMNFSVDPQGQIVIVSTEVEKLDASNAPELKAHFLQLNKVGTNYIVLDLSKTKYCDSSGLSAVLIANRLCKDTNGKFAITGLQPSVLKLIEIAQLDKVLTIGNSKDAALDLLAQ
jgi:anti-sigma B factor antagonist